MKKIVKWLFAVLVVSAILISGCTDSGDDDDDDDNGNNVLTTGKLSVPTIESGYAGDDPKLVMASHYNLDGFDLDLGAGQYSLPIKTKNIKNFGDVDGKLDLTDAEEELLKEHGFVIIDFGKENDIVDPYVYLKDKEVPIFVTSDTLLHLYHIQFDDILKNIEEREFFPALLNMSLQMLERSKQDYDSITDEDMKEAARRNVAFFSVELELLQQPTEGYNETAAREEIEQWNQENPWEEEKKFKPVPKVEYEVPDYVREDVDAELDFITAHQGFKVSPVFVYKEDYSQYVPRGHYTRSETLKRFFKAMMWYGRIAFLLKGSDIVEAEDAKIATYGACLIAIELPEVSVSGQTAYDVWNRIYTVTAFFVGLADDLTPYEYLEAIRTVFGTDPEASDLLDDEKMLEVKTELALMRNPKIYGGTGNCAVLPPVTEDELEKALDKTKGLRFMGQRFVPDSYMFTNLVSPTVGEYNGSGDPFTMEMTQLGPWRCFPRGLDVMAVMGSDRAYEILEEEGDTEYTKYDEVLNDLKVEFDSFNVSDWNKNLYWSWLYTLDSLLKDFGGGYPTFMQGDAWLDKEMQTCLASWAELRHDTILYAKQSYTMLGESVSEPEPEPEPVVGYVEPVPEFYARIGALTRMTRLGLSGMGVITPKEESRLSSLESVISRLLEISKKELKNEELEEDDYEFIRNFGENLESIATGVESEGLETTIVADVHTDTNTAQVLEEGIGYVDLIVVAYELPDGRTLVGAGPVLSYYEFKHPMSDRLTDEKWKGMISGSETPDRAPWMDSLMVDA